MLQPIHNTVMVSRVPLNPLMQDTHTQTKLLLSSFWNIMEVQIHKKLSTGKLQEISISKHKKQHNTASPSFRVKLWGKSIKWHIKDFNENKSWTRMPYVYSNSTPIEKETFSYIDSIKLCKNCESCSIQISWKIKFKFRSCFRLSVLFVLSVKWPPTFLCKDWR